MSFITRLFNTSSPASPNENHSYTKTDQEEDECIKKAIAASLKQSQQNAAISCQPGGLYNLGNTCWLNSLTQAIFKNGSTYREALQRKASMHVNPSLPEDQQAVQNAFKARAEGLLEIINASETLSDKESGLRLHRLQSIFTEAFCSIMGIPARTQHDPSEGFHLLCIFLDLDEYLPKFEIQTNLRARCTSANSFTGKEDATTIVLASRNIDSLQAAVEHHFMNPELLSGETSYDFEDGWGHQEAYKTDYLTNKSIPKQIMIQAPRFYQRKDPGIKIGSWQITAPQTILEKNTGLIEFNEMITLPIYDKYGQKIQKIATMKLVSAVGHKSSTLNSGHYVSYKREENGSYTCYNDTRTKNISPLEAQQNIAKDGYLAVYELHSVEDYQAHQAGHSGFKTLSSALPPIENLDLDLALSAPPITNAEPPPPAKTTMPTVRKEVRFAAETKKTSQISHICARALSSQVNGDNGEAKPQLSDRLSRYKRISNQL